MGFSWQNDSVYSYCGILRMDNIIEKKISLKHKIPVNLLNAGIYINSELKKNNFQCYLVGGSVRDLLLEKTISDLDFTTDATPKDVMKIFPHCVPIGAAFGTVLVVYKKISIEITTFRTETDYLDGRRPSKVNFGKDLHEDVIRRDFTVNGLAYDLDNEILYDHVNGLEDLRAKIIKTIGDPYERFREDGLRPIRGCRFMAALNFMMEAETESAIKKTVNIVSQVATERFFDEWRKTLNIKRKDIFWNALKINGIFVLFFEEFKALQQNSSRWNLLMKIISEVKVKNMAIYAACFFYIEFIYSENHHEQNNITYPLLHKFCKRSRFPAKIEKLAFQLLKSPFLQIFKKTPERPTNTFELKKAISSSGLSDLWSHIRFASMITKLCYGTKPDNQKKFFLTIKHIIRKEEPLFIKDLKINGHDLQNMGYQGKEIANINRHLLDIVLENSGENDRENLLKIAKNIRNDNI